MVLARERDPLRLLVVDALRVVDALALGSGRPVEVGLLPSEGGDVSGWPAPPIASG